VDRGHGAERPGLTVTDGAVALLRRERPADVVIWQIVEMTDQIPQASHQKSFESGVSAESF
jgi:hypothetical protein